jgi:asparagine synthase (glutamine-hydrolysing)
MLRDEYGRLHGQFLRRSELAAEGILDQGGIDVLLAEHATGRVDHGNRLWLLLNSELWYRMFIQGVTRDDLSDEIRDAPRPSALGVGSYSAR